MNQSRVWLLPLIKDWFKINIGFLIGCFEDLEYVYTQEHVKTRQRACVHIYEQNWRLCKKMKKKNAKNCNKALKNEIYVEGSIYTTFILMHRFFFFSEAKETHKGQFTRNLVWDRNLLFHVWMNEFACKWSLLNSTKKYWLTHGKFFCTIWIDWISVFIK